MANYWPGSGDPTLEVARRIAEAEEVCRVIASPKQGMMGWDMRSGLEAARGDVIGVIDGGNQFPPESFPELYRKLVDEELDICRAVRVRREFEKLSLESDDWFIDAEIMIQARRHGMRVGEMATTMRENTRASFVRPGAILEFMRNLLRECRRAGVGRVVYFGSRADHPDGGAYSRSKREAAELVRVSGVPSTTLRIAEVYGGDGADGLAMVPRLVERFPVVLVPGGASFELCPVHVDDVVDAAMDVVKTEATLNRGRPAGRVDPRQEAVPGPGPGGAVVVAQGFRYLYRPRGFRLRPPGPDRQPE